MREPPVPEISAIVCTFPPTWAVIALDSPDTRSGLTACRLVTLADRRYARELTKIALPRL